MTDTEKKPAPVKSASKRAAVDKAETGRAEAIVDAQLAEQAQHDAKVALQNARFAELGADESLDKALGIDRK